MRLRATARRLQCMDISMNTPQAPNGPHAGWAQPAPAPKEKPIYKRVWFIIVAAIAGLAVLAVAVFAAVVVADTREATRAIESCEQKAIEHAKYPGGAKIISTDVGELKTLPNGNKTLPVEGEIDMPNAFGTPVRYTYWCGLMMILKDGTIINDEPLVLPKN